MDKTKQDVAAREPVDLIDDAEYMDTGILHADSEGEADKAQEKKRS